MKTEDFKNAKEYKYGFTTDIESIRAPKGLNEDTIKFISKIKKEPKWMLDWRLKAYNKRAKLAKTKISKNKLSRFILLFCTEKFIRKTSKLRRN